MDEALSRWGRLLAPARLAGDTVPDPPVRLSLAQGYALADEVAPALGTMAGWKVGATSAGAMAALGVGEPIRGRLFAERIWGDGARIALPGRPVEAEPELALKLAHRLEPAADPFAAVGEARLAAELVRPSHPRPFDQGAGFIVADNAASVGALLGARVPLHALARPAGIEAVLLVDGRPAARGTADAVLGDPLRALAWLAAAVGGIDAGAWVLTGAIARAVAVPPGAGLTVAGAVAGETLPPAVARF